MRDQLKNLTEDDYWVYGITEPDFDHAVGLVREMIDARTEQYKVQEAKVRLESPEDADDILDDVAYYRYEEIKDTQPNLYLEKGHFFSINF